MPPDETSSPALRSGSSRNLPMWLLWIALALLGARVATGVWENRHPPVAADLVEWQPIDSAVAKARQQGRPILYDFSAEWCGPCQVMAREVFADHEAARLISTGFVPVHVVDRQQEEGRNPPDVAALQARYKVEAFPTLVIVSPDGGEPVTIEGYPGRAALRQQLMAAAMKTRMNLRIGPTGVKPDSAR